MAKRLDEALTVADTILFELDTPASSGIMMNNPVVVESVIIYYIERNFDRINQQSYTKSFYNPILESEYKAIKQLAVANPSEELITKANIAKQKMEVGSVRHVSYFSDATQVFSMGDKTSPAWHFENPTTYGLKSFSEENTGKFVFEWHPPEGSKEGNYVIYWKWVTQTGEKLSAHKDFYIGSDKTPKTSNETRYTKKDKYDILIERYLPPMYKYKLKHTDLTPEILKAINKSVAQGFTEIEDMANQLADLLDPALAHESVLPLMANMLNIRLTSSDIIRWRKQIGRAIPIYKRKGTLLALKEALDQAGIRLIKVTKLWQVTSPYTFCDGFVIRKYISNDEIIGTLTKLPMNIDNYEVLLKPGGESKFITLPQEIVRLVESLEGDKLYVVWQGNLPEQTLNLFEKDVVLIKYYLQPIPDDKQTIEDYLQSLPLMDKRDETSQEFPPKNWNTRVIEEDDPLIDVIVPSRHPFHNPVVFGKKRTDMLYSEKAYNMETYDGSLRESNIPCDIDKDFIDTCSGCLSSCFTLDIEIEELSDDRIQEAIEIIKEYSPFHAILHSINVSGSMTEFIISPVETIETLVDHDTNKSEVLESIKQQESIYYEIEWADGSKETDSII